MDASCFSIRPEAQCFATRGTLPAVPAIEFPVGDPRRAQIGRAVLGTIVLAALFVVLTLPSPNLPTMWVHGPWTVDPYHVMVSFAVPFAALLALVCMLRVPLCRRDEPLPTRRVRDLLRASRLIVALALATVASDWISLPLQPYRYSWEPATVLPLAGLVVLTVASLWAALQLRRALGQLARRPVGPDWFADAITLGERQAARLGPLRPLAIATLSWSDRCLVRRIRGHPLVLAAGTSALFGVAVALSQGMQEGYPPGGLVLFFVVAACGMFAFLMVAGWHLGLVTDRGPQPASRASRRLTRVAVASSASVPVAIAFRFAIWSAFGINHAKFSWLALDEIVLGVATATALLTLVLDCLLRHR